MVLRVHRVTHTQMGDGREKSGFRPSSDTRYLENGNGFGLRVSKVSLMSEVLWMFSSECFQKWG